ncbi:MAG: ribonuclease PH [Phycisphaeraceae bacterium]|nr:ribonuclease PH [Phycisphaeraceae bacterium]
MPTPTTKSPSRRPNHLRPVTIKRYPAASLSPASILIELGRTRVLCTASVETDLPPWLRKEVGPDGKPSRGWVTAEYAMLPGATPQRSKRGPNSRATEIQRLIARVLRAAVDLQQMPGLLITCDCDVLSADGGTRVASITGACVALAHALDWSKKQGLLPKTAKPFLGPVAAVSVGLVDGAPHLDLDYALDSRADVDLNVAMDHRGRLIEVQGTAEREPFTRKQLDQLLDLAATGIRRLMSAQRKLLRQR